MRLILFIVFLVVPVLEIATFIQVGSLIGLWPTLAGIVLTAVAGAVLVRMQGLQTINEARLASARGELPVGPLFHGLFILFAGLLLMTPGFVTDMFGFVLLIPPLRRAIGSRLWAAIKDHVEIHSASSGPPPRFDDDRAPDTGGPVIEGEAQDITDRNQTGHTSHTDGSVNGSTSSPWQKN